MAILLDSASAVINVGPSTSGPYNGSPAGDISFAVDCTGADFLLLVIGSCTEANMTVTTPQYNSSNMTLISDSNNTQDPGGCLSIWYIVNPTTGSNNVTFTIDTSGAGNCDSYAILAMPMSGVDTTTPIDTADTVSRGDDGGTMTTYTYSPSVEDTDMVVLAFASRDGVSGNVRPWTAGAGDSSMMESVTDAVDTTTPSQSSAVSNSSSTAGTTLYVAYEVATADGTVSVQGTMGEADRGTYDGFVINAASGGGGSSSSPAAMLMGL